MEYWKLAPELLHLVSIETPCAVEGLYRIDHMRRASLMNVDPDARVFAHQRAGSASVIEVDVRQQDRIYALDPKTQLIELFLDVASAEAGPGSTIATLPWPSTRHAAMTLGLPRYSTSMKVVSGAMFSMRNPRILCAAGTDGQSPLLISESEPHAVSSGVRGVPCIVDMQSF